ncbi:MAG: Gfo/Idh/MocA family oxidoreductase [Planctomycetaceae bacterium]|nr:Gfo/Idh/MocA family oxidoreductase [Planctomycetaceae bacterium]
MTEPPQTVRVTIAGTGFAADYTAQTYSMLPHRNGLLLELAGVTSGRLENAERFAASHGVKAAFATHEEMLAAVQPQIANVACANYAHGQYVREAARAGVPVIVLEKPPVIWPGYSDGRQADAATRRRESMDCLEEVLDEVRKAGSRLLYAEDFVYVDGMKALVELLREAAGMNMGRVLSQRGVCAHQGSHAPAYDTPSASGGGALFNKACHPLGPCLYLKQVEGLLRDGRPIRPRKVSAVALQVLKGLPAAAGEHFRVMQNVDDFGRITVVFEDGTVAEVLGHDLSISGIRNELSIITDSAQYDIRINPSNANELFLPDPAVAGNLLFREKLPTAAGTSFPQPRQFHAHGYVGEMDDAVACALDPARAPQSGPLMAWDTMAVLMAGYESSEKDGAFVDLTEDISRREFPPEELPDPRLFGTVLQRTG